MTISLLGRLEIRQGGVPLTMRGPQQRLLLTMLAVDANDVVPTDRLVDALWDESATTREPAAKRETLESVVTRLRRTLGKAVGLEHTHATAHGSPAGYVLTIDRDAVDMHRFEDLVGRGEGALDHGEPEVAARLLQEALTLWRGAPFIDLPPPPVAMISVLEPHRQRLQKARTQAMRLLFRAEVDLGRRPRLALDNMRRAAHEDPREEDAVALYTSHLRADGLVAEALSACEEYLEHVEREGDDPPSPTFTQLYARLRDEAVAPDVESSEPASSRPPAVDGGGAHRSAATPEGPAGHPGAPPPVAPAVEPSPQPTAAAAVSALPSGLVGTQNGAQANGVASAATAGRAPSQRERLGRMLLVTLATLVALVVTGAVVLSGVYRDGDGGGGDTTVQPGGGLFPPLGEPIVLESMNYPGCYLQVQDHQAVLRGADDIAAIRRATFVVVPGLADNRGVSLRLSESQDEYLRRTQWLLVLHTRSGASFDKDATFFMQPGLRDDKQGVSFRPLGTSGEYIRHWRSRFFVEPPGRDTHTGTPFEGDSTFYWHPPAPDGTPCRAL